MKLVIKNGALKNLPSLASKISKKFVIVTDTNLKKQGEELVAQLKKAKLFSSLLVIPSGESAKNFAAVEKLAGSLLKFGMKRDACLISLGGGVVSDVTGFLASIYMRGISHILIPTTILSMGDSCIGGKTGINLAEGKNLIGTFYEPTLIIIDPLVLRTLPDREFRSGMAEIIKHGIIADSGFFQFLRKNAAGIIKKQPELLAKMISRSVKIKQRIAGGDPKESLKPTKTKTSRMLLNYGHTVGHALEKLSHYTMPHGEAVSIGMVAENRVAVGKKILKESEAILIMETLKEFGLPTKIPAKFEASEIKKALMMDKKNIGGKIHFALPTKIGHAKIFPL